MFIEGEFYVDPDKFDVSYDDIHNAFARYEGTIDELRGDLAEMLEIDEEDIEIGYEGHVLTLTALGAILEFDKVGDYEEVEDDYVNI
jgi:hypothetical protein